MGMYYRRRNVTDISPTTMKNQKDFLGLKVTFKNKQRRRLDVGTIVAVCPISGNLQIVNDDDDYSIMISPFDVRLAD